jgi:hypothetical protein
MKRQVYARAGKWGWSPRIKRCRLNRRQLFWRRQNGCRSGCGQPDLQVRAEAALARERAQGQVRAAEAQALAVEGAEEAARMADIQTKATAALAAEKTRAATEAADLSTTNDLLLAQESAAEQCADSERGHARRVAEWNSTAQEAVPAQLDGQAQQMHWLASQVLKIQQVNLQMQAQMQAQMERMAERQTRQDE